MNKYKVVICEKLGLWQSILEEKEKEVHVLMMIPLEETDWLLFTEAT